MIDCPRGKNFCLVHTLCSTRLKKVPHIAGEYPWPHGGSLPPSNYATTSNGMTHQNSSWPPHASTYESHTGRDQYLNSGYVGPSNTTAPGYRPSQLTVSTNHVTGVRQNQIHTLPMVPVRNTAAQNSPFRERPGKLM